MSTKREEQITELAKRHGLVLIKSKAKKKLPNDHQQYRIVDINNMVLAGENFDMSLDEVEKFIQERERRPQSAV